MVTWGDDESYNPQVLVLSANLISVETLDYDRSKRLKECRLTLAVFSAQYFCFDGTRYSTDEAFVNFVTSFRAHFKKIVFCDPVIRGRETKPYVLESPKTDVCPLPYFRVYSLWKNLLVTYPKIYRIIRDNLHRWDVIWLPGPHPVTFLFAYLCRRERKPFFQVVRANLMEQVRHSNRGVKRFCGMAIVAILECLSQRIAQENLTFTVGKEMYDIYRRRGTKVHQIAVSLVSERDLADVYNSGSWELHRPVRLLCVGRLDREKGIYFLIKAVEELVTERGLEIVLNIVGKGLKGGEEKRLLHEVKKRRLSKHVHFHGYIAYGSELLDLYRTSDIFVVPSLPGEGVPQTLFEAMACGLPIVATKVAGIPYLINDGKDGLLVNPGSTNELCEAVALLIDTPELRYRLIGNGLKTVKDHTLEAERARIIAKLSGFLREKGSCV